MKAWRTIILLAWQAAWLCHGAPARPEPFEEEHPDGGRQKFWQRGDEFFSWVEDNEGAVFVRDARKRLVHAEVANGRLVPREPGKRNRVRHEEITPLAIEALQAAVEETPAMAFAAPVSNALPPRKLLVIVVGFSDIAPTSAQAFWEERFFGGTGKTVNTYFREVSKEQFYFEPAANNGVVFVTLPRAHPNPPNGSANANTRLVAHEALIAASAFVNFAGFDTNGDGVVDAEELAISIILAGYEAATGLSEPRVWAHHIRLTTDAPVVNGVTVGGGGYAMQGERHGSAGVFATIGVLCHELGHNLGLHDLYDTTDKSYGIGGHGLMGYGNWGRVGSEASGTTPVLMCAFSRCRLGFDTPEEIANGTRNLAAASLATLCDTSVLKVTTANPGEYFLVENRQPAGFDEGLQRWFGSGATEGGIAIWHIDESRYQTGANNNVARKAVDLEEANEAALGYSQLDTGITQGARAHYYYEGNATNFNATTIPDSLDYNNKHSGVAISVSGANVTVQTTRPDAPAGVIATATLDDRVSVSWQAAPSATGYKLFRAANANPGVHITTTTGLTYVDLNVDLGYAYSYWVVATNAIAESAASDVAVGWIKPIPLAEAAGAPQFTWTTGGDLPWFGQTNITRTGVALQSGRITHLQNTWIETTIPGPGVLKFYWRVSCESNNDYLSIYYQNNNSLLGRIWGFRDLSWRPALIILPPGNHTFRWEYKKNAFISSGDDAGWLEGVKLYLPSNTDVPVPYDWLDDFYPDIEPNISARFEGANGIPVWHSYVAGLNPTLSTNKFIARIAITNDTPYISWNPNLGNKRKYTIEGKTNLTDSAWHSPTNSATRFFRVKVDMPK